LRSGLVLEEFLMSRVTEKTWTIGQLLEWTARYLAEKGIESPHLDARVLLAKVLDCKPIDLYGLRYGDPATDEIRNQYRELIRRRLEGCPAAYLIGRKEFFSLALDVSPAVLIPRPDSEMVVVECLALARKFPAPRILDIGTGSGNLAIALATNLPAAEVVAVDLSEAALEQARANAVKHQVADRIQFVHGDLFAPVCNNKLFSFIVSNPPYIPQGDIASLPVGVRNYEPHLALDGGPDGFAVFDRLIAEAPNYLVEGGYLILEIGSPQEIPARRRLGAISHYQLAPTIYDGSGHPRVLRAQFQPAMQPVV
jgi:release factor glutamine methyltransferase